LSDIASPLLQVAAVHIQKLVKVSVGAMCRPEQIISLIQPYKLLSAVDTDTSVTTGQLTHVCSFGRVQPNTDQRLTCIHKFLRCVEQAEWAERPAPERGASANITKCETSILKADDEPGPEGRSARTLDQSVSFSTGTLQLPDDAMAEICNGRCGLLYSPLQLYTEHRQRAQAALLQLECESAIAQYTIAHDAAQRSKEALKDSIQEKFGRLRELQAMLGGKEAPALPGGMQDKEAGRALEVRDSEVPVAKYESPEARYAVPIHSLHDCASQWRVRRTALQLM
jgi:hypothetical protein